MKMFRLIEIHGIWSPLKFGEKYPFDYKPKGWTGTIEEVAKRHPHAWLEIKENEK